MLHATEALAQFAVPSSLRSSRFWQTTPVNCPPGSGLFINSAAVFEVADGMSPETVLTELKALERKFGRAQNYVRNAPRELDLDLLLFDDATRDSVDFTLPHPRAHLRKFVLAPAAELVPDVIWPHTGQSIRQLLETLNTDEEVAPIRARPPYCEL
tara:strand:- start:8439 stop:8906 length:468 start_codon:yes stop_codon:yes gene_type:complete